MGSVKGSATVKSVLSGDSLVLVGSGSPPPEMVLTLSGLVAPRISTQPGQADEPWAWESREYLRKRAVGKVVQFSADLKPAAQGGGSSRGFGSASLDGESLGVSVARAGWARAKPKAEAEVVSAAEEAEAKKIGVYNPEESVRQMKWETCNNPSKAAEFLAEHKGKPTRVVIEAVRQGNELRAVALEGMCMLNLHLAGVVCPRYNAPPRASTQAGASAAEEGNEGKGALPPPPVQPSEEDSSAAAAAPAPAAPSPAAPGPAAPVTTAAQRIAAAAPRAPSEPGAEEAKRFTETRLLQREVDVVLHGSDAFGNLQATVLHPKGNISAEILKFGLGKTVNYGLSLVSKSDAELLRAAETSARSTRKGIWSAASSAGINRSGGDSGAAPASGGARSFSAKVIEVVSADQLIVEGPMGEIRVSLASIRAPRIGNARRSVSGEPYAEEGKEFLRSKSIGKPVVCKVEYERAIAQGDGKEETKRLYASVVVAKGAKKFDLAEGLISEGFASVQRHRPGEERSCSYDALLAAEAEAKAQKKGMHSGGGDSASSTPPSAFLDLMGDSKRARAYLTSLQRGGVMRGIVEVVFSGSRFKVVVPRENMSFGMALSAVRCPNPDRSGPAGPRSAEPLGNEAKVFSRRNILQRTVMLQVEDMDRNGIALGHIWLGQGAAKQHFGGLLLQGGLAECDDRGCDRLGAEGHTLRAFQEEAQAAGIGIWSEAVRGGAEAAAAAKAKQEEEEAAALNAQPVEPFCAKVSDIIDGGQFYICASGPEHAEADARIEAELLKLQEAVKSKTDSVLTDARRGDVVGASFNEGSGESWFRAAVEARKPDGSLLIRYIDHGNTAVKLPGELRRLSPEVAAMPRRAKVCSLAFARVPLLGEEWGGEAARALQEMTWGKDLVVQIIGRDAEGKDAISVKVSSSDHGDKTVNELLVEEGVARVERAASKRPAASTAPGADLLSKMMEAQDVAHRGRVGMWRYGDCASDDEDGP